MTIPICPAEAAGVLAARYREDGFDTLKVKIGRDVGEDLARVLAIRRGHPHCRLILDANAAYSVAQVFELLGELRAAGIEPALLEQPVAREDWEGLGRLAREAGVPVAADESCRTPEDAVRIGRGGLAQVLNIKLAKSGVVQALDIAAIARAFGLGLMIGGMVETRLGMGFSAHLAAGLGGFDWVDLDTPLLLTDDPITGGYRSEGARVSPRWRHAGPRGGVARLGVAVRAGASLLLALCVGSDVRADGEAYLRMADDERRARAQCVLGAVVPAAPTSGAAENDPLRALAEVLKGLAAQAEALRRGLEAYRAPRKRSAWRRSGGGSSMRSRGRKTTPRSPCARTSYRGFGTSWRRSKRGSRNCSPRNDDPRRRKASGSRARTCHRTSHTPALRPGPAARLQARQDLIY